VLRITPDCSQELNVLKLEGSVRGPWVSELERAWHSAVEEKPQTQVGVELSGVSFADWAGRNLLLDMERNGARLIKPSVFLKHMLAEHIRTASGTMTRSQGGSL